MIRDIVANIKDIAANVEIRDVALFVKGHFRYLATGLVSLGLGLTLAWFVWPVQWDGARPADLLDEYKILIVNSIAEDQRLLERTDVTPGAEKILGYLAQDPRQAVNEAVALLREAENLQLAFQADDQALIEDNLSHLQALLLTPPAVPAGEGLPTVAESLNLDLNAPEGNQFIRFFSWLSILLLVGGFAWVSFRMISPRGNPVPATVRFNSDLEIEEVDAEEEEPYASPRRHA